MKKLFFTAALSVLVMGVFAQKKVLKSAEKAFKKGEYSEAVTLAKQASENAETSGNPDVYIIMGKVSLQGFIDSDFNDFDKANMTIKYFNQALGLSDENGKEDILAPPYFLPGEDTKPLKERKLATGGGEMLGLLELYAAEAGNKALDDEEYAKAYPLMELTYKLDTTSIERAFFTGYAAQLAEVTEVAQKYFRKVISLDGEYANKSFAHSQVISYHIDRKEYDEALNMIAKAKAEYPGDKSYKDLEVQVLLEADKMDEALKGLEDIIAAGNGTARVYYTLSFLYLTNENFEKAISLAKESIALDPEFMEPYFVQASATFNQGVVIMTAANAEDDDDKYKEIREKALVKFREAMPIFEKLVAADNQDVYNLRPLSTIYDQLGMDDKKDEIIKMLDKIEGGGE